uniref:Uncharacterized protein n=1 Tax=Anguilla anguilla TaxID=7936 RepID=A0A0E9PVP1_ANGAN
MMKDSMMLMLKTCTISTNNVTFFFH